MFKPDFIFKELTDITIDFLKKENFQAVILDIDDTITSHGDMMLPLKNLEWFENIRKSGFLVALISNNHEARVAPFAKKYGLNYFAKAGKPKRKGYREIIKIMKLNKDQVLMIGDQLFTDIWGAKRANIYSALVSPISNYKNPLIFLKRILEKPFIYYYKKTLKTK